MRSWRGLVTLVAVAGTALVAYGTAAVHGPALADEFIYLAGARHFAQTGELNARFYDADALLDVGYPHHDVHTPGYVIALGTLIALVSGSYTTAVALNVAAYLATALLVWRLGRALGFGPRASWIGGLVSLVLPGVLPFVYWVMAELLLGALFVAALATAAHSDRRLRHALAAGLLLGLAVLVRESALLGAPAVLSLFKNRRTAVAFSLAALVCLAAVYAPLSRNRAPGGANFWEPSSGTTFNYQAVRALGSGRVLPAVRLSIARAGDNLAQLLRPTTSWTERGILATFAFLPLWAWVSWRDRSRAQRRYLAALTLSWLVVLALLLFIYTLAGGSGFRYMMFLMPGFLPFLASGRRAAAAAAPVVLAAGIALSWSNLSLSNDYKGRRQQRQGRITAYVDRYVPPRSVRRIVLPSGWDYGLRHYPTEVISSLPRAGGGGIRALERVVSYDVLVLPGHTGLRDEMDSRAKYRRLNTGEAHPPLLVYRRLR